MPKTHDEIKKGLVEAVAEMFWATKDGDADDMRRVCGIAYASMADALVLIQILEKGATMDKNINALNNRTLDEQAVYIDQLINSVQQLQYDNAQLNRCIENMTDKLNDMNDVAAKLQAERDAAVDGLKSNCTCPECKYFSDDIQEPCRGCKPTDSKFEWRGVQKEG